LVPLGTGFVPLFQIWTSLTNSAAPSACAISAAGGVDHVKGDNAMKRLVAMLAVMVVAVLAVGTAVAVEPVKMQATALKLEHANLPVAELKKLQPPPNVRLQAVIVRQPLKPSGQATGPDLVPLAPMWLNPARPGAQAGFPAAQFPGWRATWRAQNKGTQAAGPPGWKVHFACEVINVPPGTEAFEFYNSRWCSFSEGTFNMTMALPVTGMSPDGFLKTFIGYPLFSCNCPNCPKPRVTFKVDSATNITEPGRETNNEYQVDVCLGQ
jgi:hypothetical protein